MVERASATPPDLTLSRQHPARDASTNGFLPNLITSLGICNLRPLIGVVSVLFRHQGWHSFLVQPLSNRSHSSGMLWSAMVRETITLVDRTSGIGWSGCPTGIWIPDRSFACAIAAGSAVGRNVGVRIEVAIYGSFLRDHP